MKYSIAYCLFICFLLPMKLYSQQFKLIPGLEIRQRMIFDDGYKNPHEPDENITSYISQRSRLHSGFIYDRLQAFVSIQDVRYWGDDNKYSSKGIFGNTNSISLHQAWLKIHLGKHISLRSGRQFLSYDDQRILSSRNWNDYQLTYDALLFQYVKANSKLDIAVSWNAIGPSSEYYPVSKFKTLDFIRYEQQMHKLSFSVIGLLTGNSVNDTSNLLWLRQTWGANLLYEFPDPAFRLSAYYQHHLNDHTAKVSAYCFSFYGRKEILHPKAGIGAGMDFLSGQKVVDFGNIFIRRFDVFYGRRHGWYGYMDFYNTIPLLGLQDYMLKLDYTFNKEIFLELDFHWFFLAARNQDEHQIEYYPNKDLGLEFDLSFKWKLFSALNLQCGYSFYLPSKSFKQLKYMRETDKQLPQFFYLMVHLNIA